MPNLRFRLDDLGWYQFEWLIQSLLKTKLNVTIESWGGSGDHGRDAFFDGDLVLASSGLPSVGPHLFQVKFVEAANAAGAKPTGPLVSAVNKEAIRIKQRQKRGDWLEPKHYFLITNSPLSREIRTKVSAALRVVMPSTRLHLLSGSDVCDHLDGQPALRRAFPQLLSLRDLDALLAGVVHKEALERSRLALEMAKPLVAKFVPTSAYEKTLDTLIKHNFAVLEGPPEMGKSAIAWMVGLTQLASDWDVISCDSPEDAFRLYDQGRSQLFISDDAFGRTEYNPQRGAKWEKNLERILHMLGTKHWLIWTTRKHILERALRTLDLEGRAAHFPKPGAVLVDAAKLSVREKSLILYRHAKAAAQSISQRNLVKTFAKAIVNHSAFTPERIKNFVHDRLPELTRHLADGQITTDDVASDIREFIQNPTDRMRKTFDGLPVSHKWYLISMLEAGHWPALKSVQAHYERHCPTDNQLSFQQVTDEMSESFSERRKFNLLDESEEYLQWLHPSYRDLVIEQLAADASLRRRFLSTASIDGLKLAISLSGGARGERRFPFVVDDGDVSLIQQRATVLVRSGSVEATCELLEALHEAVVADDESRWREQFLGLLSQVCEQVRLHWDHTRALLGADELKVYSKCSLVLRPMPPLPDLTASWDSVAVSLRAALSVAEEGGELNLESINEWAEWINVISETEPRILQRNGFPRDYERELAAIESAVRSDLLDVDVDDEEARTHAGACSTAVEAFNRLRNAVPDLRDQFIELCNRLTTKAERLTEKANEHEGPDDDYDPESAAPGFDIGALFVDL